MHHLLSDSRLIADGQLAARLLPSRHHNWGNVHRGAGKAAAKVMHILLFDCFLPADIHLTNSCNSHAISVDTAAYCSNADSLFVGV